MAAARGCSDFFSALAARRKISSAVKFPVAMISVYGWLAFGNRPGFYPEQSYLIYKLFPDAPPLLIRMPFFSTFAGTDLDRRRGCQTKCAGAGNDHYRNSTDDGFAQVSAGKVPNSKCDQSDRDNSGTNTLAT
jgi:hypothetical protein